MPTQPTVTPEPDVQSLLDRARVDSDASLEREANDAIQTVPRPSAVRVRQRFVQMTFDSGPSLVDLSNANALADELEDQELLAKMRAGP